MRVGWVHHSSVHSCMICGDTNYTTIEITNSGLEMEPRFRFCMSCATDFITEGQKLFDNLSLVGKQTPNLNIKPPAFFNHSEGVNPNKSANSDTFFSREIKDYGFVIAVAVIAILVTVIFEIVRK